DEDRVFDQRLLRDQLHAVAGRHDDRLQRLLGRHLGRALVLGHDGGGPGRGRFARVPAAEGDGRGEDHDDDRAGQESIDGGSLPLRCAHGFSTGTRRTTTPGVEEDSLAPGSWRATYRSPSGPVTTSRTRP